MVFVDDFCRLWDGEPPPPHPATRHLETFRRMVDKLRQHLDDSATEGQRAAARELFERLSRQVDRALDLAEQRGDAPS